MSFPAVTVLVPCRNEARFIEDCLASIVENDYPKELLQVLVIDGASTDGTTDIARRFSAMHGFISVIDNPRHITPVALNLGIAAARGAYVLWMSAHNQYDPGYIRTCVEWALRSGADNVGGIIVTQPRNATLLGRAIAAVLTHPIGVGGSKFRTSTAQPEWVDTVFGGCYRRDVFDRVGVFNELLVRGQDFEFNMRLKRAGLRTLLVPEIRSIYHARSRLFEFLKHNFVNGEWVILPFRHSDVLPVSLRHLIPLMFVASLIGAAGAAIFTGWSWVPLLLIVPYATTVIAAGAHVAWKTRSLLLGLVTPFMFAALHLSYGLGSLWGLSRTLPAFVRHLVRAVAPRRLSAKGAN